MNLDLAFMLLDDVVGDRQAEPLTLTNHLGGEKRVPDLIEHIRSNPRPGIRNPGNNMIFLNIGLDRNGSLVTDRLNGI